MRHLAIGLDDELLVSSRLGPGVIEISPQTGHRGSFFVEEQDIFPRHGDDEPLERTHGFDLGRRQLDLDTGLKHER